MLPSPFFSETPYGLGDDTAWLGRDVMQALLRLRQQHNSNFRATNDTPIHRRHLTSPSGSSMTSATCTGALPASTTSRLQQPIANSIGNRAAGPMTTHG